MAGDDFVNTNGSQAGGNDSRESSQTPAQHSVKRRKTQAQSSRGVANLTPEQLARKRANDREAQRAIRERTKNQIDRLNQRIRELESQQPYHDLQLVLREKEQIEAENADIKKRLESVLSLLQPIVRPAGGLNELAAAAAVAPSPRESSHPQPPDSHSLHSDDVLRGVASPPSVNVDGPPAAPPEAVRWLLPGEGPTSHLRRWSADSSRYESPRPPHVQPDVSFDERMGVDFLLEGGQRRIDASMPSPVSQPSQRHSAAAVGQEAPIMAPHLILPRNVPATCPLDVILQDFLADRYARAAEGVPVKALVGPLYPNFTALVYPERNVDAHPLSKLFTDILRTFPDICGLPEQVAVVFMMFLIMRWQIEPTRENYERLPEWITPRASQLFVPHPCWIDHLPWPKLRDKLISNQPFVQFDTFFIPFTTTISLNWPYSPQDCLLPSSKIHDPSVTTPSISASSPYSTTVHAASPAGPPTPQPATPGSVKARDDEQWLINPAFESHLRDVKNWSLGPSFRTTFPTFADAVNMKERR